MPSSFIASLVVSVLDLSAGAELSGEGYPNESQRPLAEAAAEFKQLLLAHQEAEDSGYSPSSSRNELILQIERAFADEPGLETRAATIMIRLLGASLPSAPLDTLRERTDTAIILRRPPTPTGAGAVGTPTEVAGVTREVVIREGGVEYPIEIAEISEVVVVPAPEPSTSTSSTKTPWAGPRRT